MAATTSSNRNRTMARFAARKATPYCTAKLVAQSTIPINTSSIQDEVEIVETCSAIPPCQRINGKVIATVPSHRLKDLTSTLRCDERRDTTLDRANPMPADNPTHSETVLGSGVPKPGSHKMIIAPH